MSSEDKLRAWMKEKGVWQKDLYNILNQNNVLTIQDLRKLPQDEFDDIVSKAKVTGFMHDKALIAIYKNQPIPSSNSNPSKTTPISTPKTKPKSNVEKDEKSEDEVRKVLKPWMEKNKIWQIDLFNIFLEYKIEKPKDFTSLSKSDFTELLTKAKQNGLMGAKVTYLKGIYEGKSVKEIDDEKEEKENNQQQQQHEQQKKNKYEEKEEKGEDYARAKLKPWMEKNEVWQIDLFKILVNDYDVYTPSDFKNLSKSKFEDLLLNAKQKGLIGDKPKILTALYYGQPINHDDNSSSKQKKTPVASPSSKPKKVEKTSEEIEAEARQNLAPWLKKHACWQIDFFQILIQYKIYKPGDIKKLSKDELEEILKEAKQKGFIGKGPMNFEEQWKHNQ